VCGENSGFSAAPRAPALITEKVVTFRMGKLH
jgi:hypothetical protein